MKEELKQGENILKALGYKKEEEGNSIFYFQNNGANEKYGFDFNKKDKTVYPVCYEKQEDMAIYIEMAELKAINLICQGLGWII